MSSRIMLIPPQNGHSSVSNTSASMNNGHAGSTQHSHDDSRILDKIGESKKITERFLRRSELYSYYAPKIEDATELQKMRAGYLTIQAPRTRG